MKAAFYANNGGPEVLQFGEVPNPPLSPTTVLIRVRFVSIQGGDVGARRQMQPPSPQHVGGYQAAGVVEAVGAKVTKVSVGDAVVGFAFSGSHAELFAVEEHHAYAVPKGMDLATAATVPIEFGTASDALFEFGRLVKGETVVVRGAAGGVGVAALELAAAAGATVIAIAAQKARLERLREFGAHHGIDYQTEDVPARILDITGGRGADLIVDLAGGAPLLQANAARGRYGLVGAASGVRPTIEVMQLASKSLTMFGLIFGKEMHTDRAHALIATLLQRAHRGDLKMPIAKSFSLSEAARAHAFIESEHPIGRVLLTTG
jgi:NADPH:quinone reductase-like Zn-dependent oxidoreductase